LSRKFAVLSVLVISLAFFSGSVFAVGDEAVRPVAGYDLTDANYDFKWNETPWIYITGVYSKDFPYTEWHNPDNTATYIFNQFEYIDGALNGEGVEARYGWFKPYAPNDWFTIRMAGTWTVYGVDGDGVWLSNPASFNVASATPEPVSSALFILGGAVLGIKRFRKKSV